MARPVFSPDGSLYVLLYTSYLTRPLTVEAMGELALRSAVRNLECGVTGLLLYCEHDSEGRFAQWMEGSRQAVIETYSRIEVDARHDSLVLLAEGDAKAIVGESERLFPNWGMAFEMPARLPRSADDFISGWRDRRLMTA